MKKQSVIGPSPNMNTSHMLVNTSFPPSFPFVPSFLHILMKCLPVVWSYMSLIFLLSDSYHQSSGFLWYYLFLHVQNISSHELKLILSKVNQKIKKSREIKASKIHILQAMIVFRKMCSVEMKIIFNLNWPLRFVSMIGIWSFLLN